MQDSYLERLRIRAGKGNPDGYAFVLGTCYACGRRFTFNPVRVPSVRDEGGVRQPICRTCVEFVNRKRREAGMEPFPIPPDAYEPVREEELGSPVPIEKGVILIKASGQVEKLRPAEKPSLKQMQEWVGGYIEPVKVRHEGKVKTMVVNEEGLIRGLPYNRLASSIAGQTIVGDVFILEGWRL